MQTITSIRIQVGRVRSKIQDANERARQILATAWLAITTAALLIWEVIKLTTKFLFTATLAWIIFRVFTDPLAAPLGISVAYHLGLDTGHAINWLWGSRPMIGLGHWLEARR
jgi:hypothetical protein